MISALGSRYLDAKKKALSTVAVLVIAIIIIVAAGLGSYFLFFQAPTSSGGNTNVTIGTAVGFSEVYYLPMIVAQEKGFWAQNGLNVTWQKFLGAPAMYQSFASSQLSVGLTNAGSTFDSASRGIGVKITGVYMNTTEFGIIVPGNSSAKTVSDLNGSTFAVTATNGLEQVYTQIVAQKFHIKVNYVQTGSLPNSLALLQNGQAKAMDFTVGSVAALVSAGKLRVIYNVTNALPSPWGEFAITATNTFIQNSPSTLKKIETALSQTINYIVNNPSFAEGVILNFTKSNAAVAALVYNTIEPSWNPSLSISLQALTNVANVYVQYGITPSNIATNVTNVYTTQFVP